MPSRDDASFLDTTADRLAALPTVRAVALGGSRAEGTHRPDSDWDLAVYYRGPFDPAEAEEGRFRVEPLLFHLAGIPTYLIVAELAINQVLRGTPPTPARYPEKLRRTASERWYGTARATLAYAKTNHAPSGRLTEVAGALATAAVQAGHAVLAARGEWVTNEKRLLERAGLRAADGILGTLRPQPAALLRAITDAETLFGTVHAA